LDGLSDEELVCVQESMDYLKLGSIAVAWDLAWSSQMYQRSVDDMVATKRRNYGSHFVTGNMPIAKSLVRVGRNNVGEAYVGLYQRDSFDNNKPNEGYTIQAERHGQGGIYRRTCFDGQVPSPFTTYPSFASDEVVGIQIKDREIHFEKNGVDLGVAFPLDETCYFLYPVAMVYRAGSFALVT
ncbi:hypothetical protein As57867_021656, partial [Aphanomyces stellatus]